MKFWLLEKKPRAIIRKFAFRFFCVAGMAAALFAIIKWISPDSNPRFGWLSLIVMFGFWTLMELAGYWHKHHK